MSEPAEPEPEPEQNHVLEQGRRLSESMLWRLQRDFYEERGIRAWSHGNVPQGITTTPHIARAYAKIALGYLRDMATQLDPSEPVYIVELGAGSGRFAYRFAKRLAALLERSSLSHKSFTYVMTDAATNLIDYWQAHPMLRPLVDAGIVDFAHFDATNRADITLINSKVTLGSPPGEKVSRGPVANPMIVVANYVFDSIPHDSFSVRDGELYENLVKVTSLRPGEGVADMDISFEPRPTQPDYYAEAELNRVLDGYRQRLADMMLLLPVAAMGCVRYFQELSSNRALFLVGDIGSVHEEAGSRGTGGIGRDGNFWLEVNFHALGEYVRELGGHAHHPPHRHASLNVSTFVLGDVAAGVPETALAYEDAIAQGGPDDFFMLTRVIADRFASMKRDDLLAFLRSTGWDSDYFVQCVPFLLESLQSVSAATRQDVTRAIEEAWDVYYPIGEGADQGDLGFCFGALLFKMEDYPRALDYFQRSLQLVGADPRTTLNIAVCLYRMGRFAESIEWIDRTLELDPANESAQEMRATVVTQRG
jgi:tetratricopeptide (TPR) repeat protein